MLRGCSSISVFNQVGTYCWSFFPCVHLYLFLMKRQLDNENSLLSLCIQFRNMQEENMETAVAGRGKELQVHFIITSLWSVVFLTYIRKIPWRILSPFIISWKSLVSLTLLSVQCLMSYWFKEFFVMSSCKGVKLAQRAIIYKMFFAQH